jgi:thiol-disulfide isomerase/thioredoxin
VLASDVPTTVVIVVALLVGASVFGVIWRRNAGRVRTDRSGDVLTPAELGADLGSTATLVQFSTSVCQPCRVARQMLGAIASDVDGVRHVEIDAEQRLDLVSRLNVLRTPTVLVLDERGRVVSRAAGAPRRADMLAAVGAAGATAVVGRRQR